MNLLAQAVHIMRKKYPEKLKIFEEVKNTEFKEEPEETEKYNFDKEGFDKEGLHKDTKNKYVPNGLDKYGKHKDTNTFLNKEKNIIKDILENIN